MAEVSKCKNCYYSNRMAHPGQQPEPIYRSFLGIIAYKQYPPQHIIDNYNMHKHLYENALQCQRYPRLEIVYNNYGCGEFIDKLDK
jgi:hypothetical protein